MLEPVINMPVSIALYDLDEPVMVDEKGGVDDGVSVQTHENQKVETSPEELEEREAA